MDKMVTEDEDAGLEYYQALYGDKVTTSHGNSNLSKYGAQNTLLIGDGCAIGAYIQDLVLTGSALYLPESKSKLNDCYIKPCCCKGTMCDFFTRNKIIE